MVARTENVERGTSTLCPVGFPRPYEAKATPRLSPALRQEIQGLEVVIHASPYRYGGQEQKTLVGLTSLLRIRLCYLSSIAAKIPTASL